MKNCGQLGHKKNSSKCHINATKKGQKSCHIYFIIPVLYLVESVMLILTIAARKNGAQVYADKRKSPLSVLKWLCMKSHQWLLKKMIWHAHQRKL
jgi:hypothetical protein